MLISSAFVLQNHNTEGLEFKQPSVESSTYRNTKESKFYGLWPQGPTHLKALSLSIQRSQGRPF